MSSKSLRPSGTAGTPANTTAGHPAKGSMRLAQSPRNDSDLAFFVDASKPVFCGVTLHPVRGESLRLPSKALALPAREVLAR